MTLNASFALSASKPLENNAKREQHSRYGHNNHLPPFPDFAGKGKFAFGGHHDNMLSFALRSIESGL